MSKQATCPECGADIEIAEGTVQGEIIVCDDCGVDLEVISVEPIEIAPAPEEEEDWGE